MHGTKIIVCGDMDYFMAFFTLEFFDFETVLPMRPVRVQRKKSFISIYPVAGALCNMKLCRTVWMQILLYYIHLSRLAGKR